MAVLSSSIQLLNLPCLPFLRVRPPHHHCGYCRLGWASLASPVDTIIANISGIAIPENCTKELRILFANLCTLTNTGVTRAEWERTATNKKGCLLSNLFSTSLGLVLFPVLTTLLQVVNGGNSNNLSITELDLNLFTIQTNISASPKAFVVPLSDF